MSLLPSCTKSLCRVLATAGAAVALAGCNTVVLNPSGDVARQQGELIVISTILMLLIIVPVIALTLWFAWKYRAANKDAEYSPDWDHSTQLELVIWAAPLLIIIALGAITWISTHTLDPYRRLDRIDVGKPVAEGTEPLVIQVVALDWKWLFFYPGEGIATINEIAVPVDREVQFKITSASVMNSFFIPAMAGQIYAMSGMETTLHGVINAAGDYEGFSSNYSGAGFSGMRFRMYGMNDGDYRKWVARVKRDGDALDRQRYLEIEKPSEREPAHHYARVDPQLYHAILNRCVEPGQVCMDAMMMRDAQANGNRRDSGKRADGSDGAHANEAHAGSAAADPHADRPANIPDDARVPRPAAAKESAP